VNDLQIGRINQLLIERKSENGLYLKSKSNQEVLLPNAYVMPNMKIGDYVNVFIYTDSEDRLVATTHSPEAKLGEFARLHVKHVTSIGAFCDWGLPKDLFVPLKFQKTPFRVGQWRSIRVSLDELTNRLIGVEKFGKFISKQRPDFKVGQKVKIFVLAKTPLGYKVIIENRFEGMIFDNEIFEPINLGDKKEAFIKKVRFDGKVDLSLMAIEDKDQEAKKSILEALRLNDYMLELTTKSPPEIIYKEVKLSKKAFKKALNALVEEGVVKIENEKIHFLIASKRSN